MKIEIKGAIIPNDDKWIYDWCEMDATCPRDIAKIIDTLPMGEPLDVYINSPGGEIFTGSEIYALLQEYNQTKGRVINHVVGLAASAASVILCAAESDIAPTAMVMMHNVISGEYGDYRAMDKKSEVLQKATRAMANAYTKKTGKSEEEILEIMNHESWFTAREAVEMGLVDRIAEPEYQLINGYRSPLLPQKVIEKIRNSLKDPHTKEADFLLQKKAQLELLKLGGIR